jgi:hypothetical protein
MMEHVIQIEPSLEQRLRVRSVELAIELTLKDEALFAGGMLEYASRIYHFINTGEVNKTPLQDRP